MISGVWIYYLWIYNENFAFWDPYFKVTNFISVSVSKTSIEWIAIWRKQCLYILENNKPTSSIFLQDQRLTTTGLTSRQEILNSCGALRITDGKQILVKRNVT